VVSPTSVRLMKLSPPMDHGKATRELGWTPAPVEEAVRAGVRFFLSEPAHQGADGAGSKVADATPEPGDALDGEPA